MLTTNSLLGALLLIVLLVCLFQWGGAYVGGGGFLGAFSSASSSFGGAAAGGVTASAPTPSPADGVLPRGDSKEAFAADAAPAPTSAAASLLGGSAPAGAAIKPSELLPTDNNFMWASVGGANSNITGQLIPAEIMDPTRMPHFTSTSKSKLPNLQMRPDPLVDRTVAAGQLFFQAPDTHQDPYRNRGVDITAVRPE